MKNHESSESDEDQSAAAFPPPQRHWVPGRTPLSHEPGTINDRVNNELFDNILKVLSILKNSKILSLKIIKVFSFVVSWFLGFKVSWLQSFEDSMIQY